MKTNHKRDVEIIKLYLEGMKQKDIGEIYGIKQAAVSYIVIKNNIKMKPDKFGNKNSNWKGGVMYDDDRKLIYSPKHPHPNFLKKYCYEYVLIMEKELGRYLKPNEIVHHVNGDKTDNRVENLRVMTQKEHIELHRKQGDMVRRKFNG